MIFYLVFSTVCVSGDAEWSIIVWEQVHRKFTLAKPKLINKAYTGDNNNIRRHLHQPRSIKASRYFQASLKGHVEWCETLHWKVFFMQCGKTLVCKTTQRKRGPSREICAFWIWRLKIPSDRPKLEAVIAWCHDTDLLVKAVREPVRTYCTLLGRPSKQNDRVESKSVLWIWYTSASWTGVCYTGHYTTVA